MKVLFLPLFLMIGCSHHSSMNKFVSKRLPHTFFSYEHQRSPASLKDKKKFNDLVRSIKSSPIFLEAPVGLEVVMEDTNIDGDKIYKSQIKKTYLGKKDGWNLILEQDDNSKLYILSKAYEQSDVEQHLRKMLSDKDKIQTVTDKKFALLINRNDSRCETILDMTKSVHLSETQCRDKDKKLMMETRLLSQTVIDPAAYLEDLKSIRMSVEMDAINCYEQDGTDCRPIITDSEPANWTRLIK